MSLDRLPALKANRNQFIGGSDARIIMGKDEKALLRLWREKRGEEAPLDLSGVLIVQLGLVTEDLNRRWFELNSGHRISDVQRHAVHRTMPWMAATLDGLVKETGAVFEAKFMLPWSFSEEAAAEIRRERILKGEVIKFYIKEIIAELIKSELGGEDRFEEAYFRIFLADERFAEWVTDPEARADIEKALAAKGYDSSFILAQAYMKGADKFEAIDKRIAFHEQRRTAALREAGIWSDGLQRRLEQAAPEVIEGEFTTVAEKQ
jgi:YqaJ-like viral recombinase domain